MAQWSSTRTPGEINGNPLQYSSLGNPKDRGACWAMVHGVAEESRIIAWRIPETGEPGGLPSMGSHRVGHDRSDLATIAAEHGSEEAMVTHSSTLAWKIPWTKESGRLRSTGSQSRTRLSDFTFTFHFHALEKEMATHSSVLAWRIPGMGEPGGLPSMGSHRVGHD